MIKHTASIVLFLFLTTEISFPQEQVYHLTEIKKPIFMGISKPLRDMKEEPAFQRSGKNDNVVPNQKYLPPHRITSDNPVIEDPWLQTKEGLRAPGDIILNMEAIKNIN